MKVRRVTKATKKNQHRAKGRGPRPARNRITPRAATMPRPMARRARRNPDDAEAQAAALTEAFHGRPVRSIKDYERDIATRAVLADLGRLIDLKVWTDEDTCFVLTPDRVRLAASGDGQQLYFIGGDQQLDLLALGLRDQAGKDHARIGEVETISYHTSKDFHDFEPSDYEHEFGEEGGSQPTLCYDALNATLYLTGGSYTVKREGITN